MCRHKDIDTDMDKHILGQLKDWVATWGERRGVYKRERVNEREASRE